MDAHARRLIGRGRRSGVELWCLGAASEGVVMRRRVRARLGRRPKACWARHAPAMMSWFPATHIPYSSTQRRPVSAAWRLLATLCSIGDDPPDSTSRSGPRARVKHWCAGDASDWAAALLACWAAGLAEGRPTTFLRQEFPHQTKQPSPVCHTPPPAPEAPRAPESRPNTARRLFAACSSPAARQARPSPARRMRCPSASRNRRPAPSPPWLPSRPRPIALLAPPQTPGG